MVEASYPINLNPKIFSIFQESFKIFKKPKIICAGQGCCQMISEGRGGWPSGIMPRKSRAPRINETRQPAAEPHHQPSSLIIPQKYWSQTMRNTLSPLGQIRMTKSGKYCMRPRKSWARTLRAVNRQQNTDISLVPDYPTAAQDKPENIFHKNPLKSLSISLLQFQKYFSKGVNRSFPLTISRANKDAALSWHFPAISIGLLISNSEDK